MDKNAQKSSKRIEADHRSGLPLSPGTTEQSIACRVKIPWRTSGMTLECI